jgi:hypothetical protein
LASSAIAIVISDAEPNKAANRDALEFTVPSQMAKCFIALSYAEAVAPGDISRLHDHAFLDAIREPIDIEQSPIPRDHCQPPAAQQSEIRPPKLGQEIITGEL